MNKELKMRVEIPKGSINKYEYNEQTKEWELDRVLFGSMHYPEEYGSLPKTLAEDGDPLDVLCIIDQPTFAGCYLPIRVIGLMEMKDNGEWDHKIIAVNDVDPCLEGINEVTDLSEGKRNKIVNFFRRYKELEGKEVEIPNYPFRNSRYAWLIIKECQARFKKTTNE